MGLFGLSWGKKTPPVQYSKDKGGNYIYKLTDHDLGQFKSCFKGGYSEANMITLFESIPEVFAPIDAIASRVANGVFQLKKIKTDEVVYDNKVWNRLTTQPNWRMTWHRFIYNAVVYKLTAGNRYFYKYVPSVLKPKLDNISALWLLPPQYTEPHLRSDRPKFFAATSMTDMVDYYNFQWWGDTDNIPAELVYHDPNLQLGYDQANPLKGKGPLTADEYPMSNLVAVYQSRNVIYVKRGALGYLVNKKEDESGTVALTKPEKQALRDETNSVYGVTGGRDLIGITDVPVEFVRVAMSIEELQPFDETFASAAAIYGTLQVPRSFIPSKEGVTFNNGASDERKLYQDVVIKEAKELAQILTTLLGLEQEGLYADVSFDHVEVLQEDKKAKAETNKMVVDTNLALYEKGHITKNQFLVAIGQEEIPGGDVYITDGQNPDPMAIKLGVGGLQGLKDILTAPLPADVKKNVLVLVFGFAEGDAAKLVSNETTPEN